eukprot:m51a1_g5141 putative enhancer of rudimentary homolog (105) ;mRNA; r:23949-24476
MSHTILLVQYSNLPSRTYFDFESLPAAVDGVCRLYEQKLKSMHQNAQNITYDVSDLMTYIDSLADLSALQADAQSGLYIPRNRAWIKQQVYQQLRRQVQQGGHY